MTVDFDPICEFCAETYPPEEAECCDSCTEGMCERCLETHECIPEPFSIDN